MQNCFLICFKCFFTNQEVTNVLTEVVPLCKLDHICYAIIKSTNYSIKYVFLKTLFAPQHYVVKYINLLWFDFEILFTQMPSA